MVSVSPHFALRSRLSSSMPVGKARKRTNNGRGRCRALWRVLTAEGRRLQTRRSPFEAATAFKIFHSLILSPHHCRRVEGGNVFSSLAAASTSTMAAICMLLYTLVKGTLLSSFWGCSADFSYTWPGLKLMACMLHPRQLEECGGHRHHTPRRLLLLLRLLLCEVVGAAVAEHSSLMLSSCYKK